MAQTQGNGGVERQPAGIYFLTAGHAIAVFAVIEAYQCRIDLRQTHMAPPLGPPMLALTGLLAAQPLNTTSSSGRFSGAVQLGLHGLYDDNIYYQTLFCISWATEGVEPC